MLRTCLGRRFPPWNIPRKQSTLWQARQRIPYRRFSRLIPSEQPRYPGRNCIAFEKALSSRGRWQLFQGNALARFVQRGGTSELWTETKPSRRWKLQSRFPFAAIPASIVDLKITFKGSDHQALPKIAFRPSRVHPLVRNMSTRESINSWIFYLSFQIHGSLFPRYLQYYIRKATQNRDSNFRKPKLKQLLAR